MAKVKKVFLTVITFLLTVLICMPLIACENQADGGEKKSAVDNGEVAPLGLYTDLQFALNGENGYVQASVKNKFTLFPSTVTVNLELYRWDSYTENVDEMVMVSSSYIYDLDQGETIIAAASTGGKQSYWKARASYRVDNKAWQEKFSETVLFDANGIKTSVSAPVPDNREYYVADFLQPDAEIVKINISLPPLHKPGLLWAARVVVYFENEDQINTARDIFDGIKLEPFDLDTLTVEERLSFYCMNIGFDMNIRLSDGSSVHIGINDHLIDKWGINLFVTYDYTENGCKVYKDFAALISDETKEAITELANDAFYKEYGKIEVN